MVACVLQVDLGTSLHIEGNDAREREKGAVQGGGTELQGQALWKGEIMAPGAIGGEVAFERGTDTSALETRGVMEKMSAEDIPSVWKSESMCTYTQLITCKHEIRTVAAVCILGGRM